MRNIALGLVMICGGVEKMLMEMGFVGNTSITLIPEFLTRHAGGREFADIAMAQRYIPPPSPRVPNVPLPPRQPQQQAAPTSAAAVPDPAHAAAAQSRAAAVQSRLAIAASVASAAAPGAAAAAPGAAAP